MCLISFHFRARQRQAGQGPAAPTGTLVQFMPHYFIGYFNTAVQQKISIIV